MRLHLLPLPERKRMKCDTRALLQARSETTLKLKMEVRATAREDIPENERVRQRRSTLHYLRD